MYQKIPTLCSDCIKSNNKNDLISNYYSILISNNIQKQKRLITINQCTHFIQCPIIRNSAKTVHLHINKLGKILLIFTWLELFRNSRPGVFCKKCVLRNFAKFTCVRVSFLAKLQASEFWLLPVSKIVSHSPGFSKP